MISQASVDVMAILTARYSQLDTDAYREGAPTTVTVETPHEGARVTWRSKFMPDRSEFMFEQQDMQIGQMVVVINAPQKLLMGRLINFGTDITIRNRFKDEPSLVKCLQIWLENYEVDEEYLSSL